MRATFAAAILLGAGVCRGQAPASTVVGQVRDASGASVAGAALALKHVDTNETRRAVTGSDGEFTIPDLAPGAYELTAEKEGFERLHQTGLVLAVDQIARLDLALKVGSVTQTVEVTAETPLLNTENASKGDVIVTEEIAEMPLEGRDFQDLAFLVPGVARKPQGGSGSNMAINGARADNTNFTIDGFNDQNPRGGGAQARPPVHTMQEFKMQTSGYSAETGRVAGGVMNMVLKSGGNRVHGDIFEFIRNELFDARNFFAIERPKLRRNQFGATLSGPVWIPRIYNGRNRTFFLFGWESQRQLTGQTRTVRVPTELERTGDFSATNDAKGALILAKDPLAKGTCGAAATDACFPGNRIPASRLHPIALKLLPYYPAANRPGELNNFVSGVNDVANWDSFLAKIDHRLSPEDNLSVRYLRRLTLDKNPFSGSASGVFPTWSRKPQMLLAASHTRVFTPTLVNDLRLGWSRTHNFEQSAHDDRDYIAELGLKGVSNDPSGLGFPRFTVRDLVAVGDPADVPFVWTVNNYQAGDTFTLVRSRHLIKFGGELLRTQFFHLSTSNDIRGTFNFLGRWTNIPFADLLLGYLNDTSRKLGKYPAYIFQTTAAAFFQDDLRARKNLTLNLGVRWELMTPPTEKYGRIGNFIPGIGRLILGDDRGIPDLAARAAEVGLSNRVGVARDYGVPAKLIYANYRRFAPRAGFAWRPYGGNRAVVRGGYGIFYASSMLDPIRTTLTKMFPLTVSQTYSKPSTNPLNLSLSDPFPSTRGTYEGLLNIAGYDLRPPSQYLQSWNLTIEREIAWACAVEIGYVGSKGTHLARRYNLNQPYRNPALRLPSGSFPRPVAEFNTIDYFSFGANSNYNAGILSVRRRMARGFFYRASYVYSKSIDDASQAQGASDGGYSGAQNARDLKGERGRSDWDNGHAFTMSFMYEIPLRRRFLTRGWQMAATGRLYTGQPFTPHVSNVDLNLGDANRPDRIRKGTLENPSPRRWFDLDAFPEVPRGSYRMGSSGRNILDGPGFVGMNVSLMRKFRLRERGFFQFRAEAFNVSNHANFKLPNNDVNAVNGGVISSANAARILQFGLKYQF